jgi:zinc protease
MARSLRLRRLASIILLVTMTAVPALAQKSGTAKPTDPPHIEFEKYTLANGLQVILHVDRKLPIVHVNEWFHVGSKNERSGRSGFAHLFEHMMFQGSKNAPGEYFTWVEKGGGNINTGGVNGTTSFDRTNYFATVPSANLEYLLWLESDRVATLADALTQETLDNQRMVVKNERRQSYENTPYGRAWSILTENIFPAGHPYAHDVIGSHEDLTAATLDDVRAFFRTYYTPNNLSLVIAGDFDVAEAKRLVEKYFGGIQPGPALEQTKRWIPKLDAEKIVEAKDRVPEEAVYLAWPTPPMFDADEASLDMASSVLTDGLSSRLQKALAYDRQLVTNTYSFNDSRELASMFVVVAEARPGAGLDSIESIITAEIARLAKSGPTAGELERAKTKWETGYVSGLERIGGFGGKADRLNTYNTFKGTPDLFAFDVARYRGVTIESVRAAAARWLDTHNRVLVRFRPESSSRDVSSAVDRSKPPALGADRAFAVPAVQTATLENGLQVYVVTRTDLPKVSVSLGVRAGSVADPAGKEGVASLLAQTITAGTSSRSALSISDALGDLGVGLAAGAEREYATIGFESLTRNVDAALAIMSDVVRNPSLPADEVARIRARAIDQLAQEDNDPRSVSRRVSRMMLFGKDHPYGRPADGTPSSVASITRDDLAEFHRTWWKPSGSALVFAGDITLDDAVAEARKHFGAWAGAAPHLTISAPEPAPAHRIYLVDRQDAAQTVVAQVLPAPKRSSDDYYPIELANAVWGGAGFATRLNLNLREDKGYSYGMFSRVSYFNEAGAWIASGGVQTDKTKESMVEMRAELAGLTGARPITEAELDRSRELKLRSFSQQFETLGRVAGKVIEAWSFHLAMSEIGREPSELERTDLAKVDDVVRRYLASDRSFFVLVGDRGRIESAVRSLDAGELIVIDARGNVVTGDRTSDARPVPGR